MFDLTPGGVYGLVAIGVVTLVLVVLLNTAFRRQANLTGIVLLGAATGAALIAVSTNQEHPRTVTGVVREAHSTGGYWQGKRHADLQWELLLEDGERCGVSEAVFNQYPVGSTVTNLECQ